MVTVPPGFAAATVRREGQAGSAWTLVRGLTEDPVSCEMIVRQLI